MKLWKKVKLWFDTDQRLTVAHMGERKVFNVESFRSKRATRLSGSTIDGRKFLLVNKTPMEFEVVDIPTDDPVYSSTKLKRPVRRKMIKE